MPWDPTAGGEGYECYRGWGDTWYAIGSAVWVAIGDSIGKAIGDSTGGV